MHKYKRLIIFFPAYEEGGAAYILTNLINFFLKQKINIILLCLNGDYKYFIKSRYLKIININKNKRKYLFKSRIFFNIFSIVKLVNLLINNNKKETILFSMQSHFIPSLIGKFFNFRVIIRNSEDPFGATKYSDNKFTSILVFMSKFLTFNLADKIITNAFKAKESIKFFLLNKSKVKIILNPYIKISNNKSKKKIVKKNQILAIGRFAKQKNFEFLIEVFSEISDRLKNYNLIIIGSGSGKGNMIKKIDNLNIKDKVKIKSWSKNLSDDFKMSKIFVLPSLYEGCPNILIDAIAHEIPCISSNCSGALDVLKNNKAGLIYSVNEKKEIKKHILKILSNYNFFQKAAIKFGKTKKRFLIDEQSKKYLKYLLG